MLKAAELMSEHGFTLAQAVNRLKIALPGPGQFAGALERVSNATGGPARQIAQRAMQLGYSYGGHLGKRMAFYAAQVAAAATTPAVIGSVLAGAAVIGLVGVIYVYSGDKAILPGPAMNKPKPEAKANPGVTHNPDNYFVFLLPQVSGGSIYVGQESQLKEMHPCDMPGGGPCGDNDEPLKYEAKSQGFKTYGEATDAWCADLKGKERHNHPVAGDSTVTVYGGEYWIGTAPSCPEN
jgi:hypothetical protein